VRAAVPVLIEVASQIAKATGFEGSLRIDPLQSLVMFLAVSQPRTTEKSRRVEVEYERSLDRFLLFVTLGQAFLLIALVGLGAVLWTARRGHARAPMMLEQGATAAVALVSAIIVKAASGQALEEVLVYLGALMRAPAPSVPDESPQ
jgi:hypothetical protein